MATTQEIVNFINTVLCDGSQSVTANDDIIESGLIDSLAILQLVEFINDKFDVAVDPDAITPENFSTPQRIANLVTGALPE